MQKDILVSVVMSVYNTPEQYLREAIESVLTQTHKNFEFIIIDDASEMWCRNILRSYKDDRIHIYENEVNRGLAASLNRGLMAACGKYIARMDSDDICKEGRLEDEISYLEEHPDIDVLACVIQIYDEAVKEKNRKKRFAGAYRVFEQERMRIRLSLDNIKFAHPTVVYRREFLEKNKLLYNERYRNTEDYDMWLRCIEYGKFAVLQRPLLLYRIHRKRASDERLDEQREVLVTIKKEILKRLIPNHTKRQGILYAHLRSVDMYGSAKENIELIHELVTANDKKEIYNPAIYRQELFFWWFRKSLNPKNAVFRHDMLNNQYIRINITKIFLPQMVRYVADGIDQKWKCYKWRK